MKKQVLVSLVCVVAFTGCMSMVVPKTTIKGSIGGQPFSLVSPKDSTLTGLDVSAQTNGTIKLHIDSLAVKMSPDVITTTGDAQVKLVDAIGTKIIEAAKSAKP